MTVLAATGQEQVGPANTSVGSFPAEKPFVLDLGPSPWDKWVKLNQAITSSLIPAGAGRALCEQWAMEGLAALPGYCPFQIGFNEVLCSCFLQLKQFPSADPPEASLQPERMMKAWACCNVIITPAGDS